MENLKRVREEKGITQADLAEMVGLSQAFVSRIEAGRANPTLDKIRAIATALQTEPAELFTLPDFQRRAISALGAIDNLEEREAALIVLESMARFRG